MPYMTMMPCFMYMMNRNNHYFGINIINHHVIMRTSLVDLAWVWMVGTSSVVNWSNIDKLQFVKILNKHGFFALWWTHFEHPHFGWPIALHLAPIHLCWTMWQLQS
jgi:hypothetical protein